MLRHTLLLVLLAGSASAQTTPDATAAAVTTPLQAAPATRTAADTIEAIHRLYAKRRRVGRSLTFGAVAADVLLATASAVAEEKGSGKGSGGSGFGIPGGSRPMIQFGVGGFAVLYGIIAAPVMGVGIQQAIAYSTKREQRVLARYETTHQLPAKIARQLRKHLR